MAKLLRTECNRGPRRHGIALGLRWHLLIACLAACDGLATEGAAAQQATNQRPPIVALACSPDGKQVVAGGQFGVEIYELAQPHQRDAQGKAVALKEPARKLNVQMANVHAIAFSPTGDLVAIGGGAPSDGGALTVYSWPDLVSQFRVEPHSDLIYAVAWSSDGTQLATVSYDRQVKLLSAEDGSEISTLSGHSRPVLDVTWLPDSEAVATVGVDRSLRVWNTSDATLARSPENHTQTIHAIALRPNVSTSSRPMVATAGADKTVRFWQPTIGRMVRFARLDSAPLDIAWTEDGRWAIAVCEDGRLRTINPETADVIDTEHVSSARLECVATVADSGETRDQIAVGDSAGRVFLVKLTKNDIP